MLYPTVPGSNLCVFQHSSRITIVILAFQAPAHVQAAFVACSKPTGAVVALASACSNTSIGMTAMICSAVNLVL